MHMGGLLSLLNLHHRHAWQKFDVVRCEWITRQGKQQVLNAFSRLRSCRFTPQQALCTKVYSHTGRQTSWSVAPSRSNLTLGFAPMMFPKWFWSTPCLLVYLVKIVGCKSTSSKFPLSCPALLLTAACRPVGQSMAGLCHCGGCISQLQRCMENGCDPFWDKTLWKL